MQIPNRATYSFVAVTIRVLVLYSLYCMCVEVLIQQTGIFSAIFGQEVLNISACFGSRGL